MKSKQGISMSVIRRLPIYYRFLSELKNSGVAKTSSKELSEKMGFTASQIRQDFNCFGGFGQQGYGYNVAQLRDEIAGILELSKRHKCILVGAGNLGRSITMHIPFNELGFDLIGVFDDSPAVIGTKLADYTVEPFDSVSAFIKKNTPEMAILCVPRYPAEEIVSALYKAGIKAFWNFTHYDIAVDFPDVISENVHLNDSMMTLGYRLNQK